MVAQESRSRILVADDDREDFLAIEIAFEDLSVSVLLAHVGYSRELMEALESSMPDILLLDILMPTQTGMLTLQELRANRKYDSLPIIMYSSMSDPQTIDFCFKEGANFFLIKPKSFKELNMALKRIMAIDWKQRIFYPSREFFVLNDPKHGI